MKWPSAEDLVSTCKLPQGYAYQVLREEHIPEVASSVLDWQPTWRVGSASAFTQASFYREKAYLDQGAQRDVFVLLIRAGTELAAVLPMERLPEALTLYGCLAVVSPAHRGRFAPQMRGDYLEAVARLVGLEFIYAMATLRHTGAQRWFEFMGYRLVGFAPGYDREEISPGVVKRVIEAIYAKSLVPEEALLSPSTDEMTPTVRKAYEAFLARN
ncbi:MAG: hypothetical protein EKK47_19710 [Burkholderiales bacterium]|jgi:hypothetical protein|nr:MAG: hypothetical protein EKK47_19710 [Burkholderiales bacterium]